MFKWFIGLQDEKKELLLFWVKMFFSRPGDPEVLDMPLLADALKPPEGKKHNKLQQYPLLPQIENMLKLHSQYDKQEISLEAQIL